MPLYEYECTQCRRITEKRQKFSDPEITECPHCHGKLERVLSAPAVHFAGGGWYADLYSSKGGAKKDPGNSGDGAPAGDSTKSSEGGDSAKAADTGKNTDSAKASSSGDSASTGTAPTAPASQSTTPASTSKS